MVDLKISRERIDEIDSQIVDLFEKRMEVANEVAKYKLETGKAVYDKEREEQKLRKLASISHGEFNEKAVVELFSQIMSISRKYQYSVLPHKDSVTDYEKIDKLPIRDDMKIYYFGLPGSHTQEAMEDFFGKKGTGISCSSFRKIMEAVESGEADYGVLPIENSSTGGITANYDLILKYNNSIVGQYVKKIDQCLIGLPGAKIEDIEKVYSHPQGLAQCRVFLEKNKKISEIDAESTSTAARKVFEDQMINQAAIASERAASEYGLEVIAKNIQQEKNNSTRFIVIARDEIYTHESNKIALCIELPHKSGSLYRILSHFLYNNLNMTQIESRPIPGRNWEYRFFIDIEGNLEMPEVQNALRGVREEAVFMRVLGNFEC